MLRCKPVAREEDRRSEVKDACFGSQRRERASQRRAGQGKGEPSEAENKDEEAHIGARERSPPGRKRPAAPKCHHASEAEGRLLPAAATASSGGREVAEEGARGGVRAAGSCLNQRARGGRENELAGGGGER